MGLTGNNIPVFSTSPQSNGGSATYTGSNLGTLGSANNGVVIYQASSAGTRGSRIYGLYLSNSAATVASVFLYINLYIPNTSTTITPIGIVSVPANAGNSASVPCVNAITSSNCPGLPQDGMGRPYLELARYDNVTLNSTLQMSICSAGTNPTTIYASVVGADY